MEDSQHARQKQDQEGSYATVTGYQGQAEPKQEAQEEPMSKTKTKQIKSIDDLTPDPRNANRGTERGAVQLENSLRDYGAGRSILVDKNGVVIAGNKTLEQAASLGMEVQTVCTDGNKLVVVQREDLDLDADSRARELAIADNRVAQIDLDWDVDELRRELDDGVGLDKFFFDHELDAILNIKDSQQEYEDAWKGMPEFNQEDLLGVQKIIVHFARRDDVDAFAKLIGQKITEKTKSLWYPKAPEREEIVIDES